MESVPNERLGIPAIKMSDGPMGVRNWTGSSARIHEAGTPSPVLHHVVPVRRRHGSHAGTWIWCEPRATRSRRRSKALGRDMILAPTVNIHRTPLWGRNFEGYGEDPYLAAAWASLTSRACRARASSRR